MSKVLMTVFALVLSSGIYAGTKGSCGKYTKISCSEIENAKRDSFCWKKGQPSIEKKTKICKTEKRRKRVKKSLNKKTTKS